MPAQVPASPPVRMEVRINGKVFFANTVYAPKFDNDENEIIIRAAKQPTLVNPKPGVVFPRDDPREGATALMVAHDGRGTPVEPEPEPEPPAKKTTRAKTIRE